MLAQYQLNLSAKTWSHLSHLPADATIHHVVMFNECAVGVCSSESIPSHLILPGGLTWRGVENVTVGNLLSSSTHSGKIPVKDIVTLRLQAHLPLRQSICAAIETIQSSSSSLILINGVPLREHKTLGDIVNFKADKNTSSAKKQNEEETIAQGALSMSIYLKPSRNEESGEQQVKSLRISYPDEPILETGYLVDVIAHLSTQSSSAEVRSTLAEAIKRYSNCLESIPVQKCKHLQTRHFSLFGCGLGLTWMSPSFPVAKEETTEQAIAGRLEIHRSLILPENRPLLRSGCITFSTVSSMDKISSNASITLSSFDGGHPGRLSDVHNGLKSPVSTLGPASDVSVHLVEGHYLYCHYQQDNFDDSGWGCAYRSLQTLISWCIFERYLSLDQLSTSKSSLLPSHIDIQQSLVHIGDKPSSFLKSKNWIGANEVCYALDELAQIQSRILHVSSGAAVASEKGRELARHFDTQGSPVMIGGGVLAWTLLGIARNNVTGKCRFLILDPHYEGRDKLETIQAKGWVGWKSEDIFKSSAFYNFCLPQRPNTV